MNTKEQYGMWVRGTRGASGLTQVELADEMTKRGVPWSRDVVARLETGRRHLRAYELAALQVIKRESIPK